MRRSRRGTGAATFNRAVISTTKIVLDPLVVIETERVVDDPPRVIERGHVVEDAPVPSSREQAVTEDGDSSERTSGGGTKRRVIQADAEVTIVEPDRMIIRLVRKRHGARAKAPADE